MGDARISKRRRVLENGIIVEGGLSENGVIQLKEKEVIGYSADNGNSVLENRQS